MITARVARLRAAIFDELGAGMTLLISADPPAERGVPMTTVSLASEERGNHYGEFVPVSPDQHVAWCGDGRSEQFQNAIDVVRAAAREKEPV